MFSPIGNIFLPQVGPFEDQGAFNINSLSNLTISSNTGLTTVGTSRTNPIRCKTLTIASNVTISSSTYAIFIQCNKLVVGSSVVFDVNGSFAGDGDNSCHLAGGQGGSGASGGGGGAVSFDTGTGGGAGGDGLDGDIGSSNCCSATPGIGGTGWGAIYAPSMSIGSYTYPEGGSGSNASSHGPWGRGGNGGNAGGCCTSGGGGGGGSGGGLLVIASNQVVLSAPASLQAAGGNGGLPAATASGGDGGGGGAVLGFFKQYTGSGSNVFIPSIAGGNGSSFGGGPGVQFSYEINHAGTAILNSYANFTNSWNHL